jgi:hypothetical protein
MRSRDRVLQSLENVYREAFQSAEGRSATDEMARLDFEYQRDQLQLEVLLDVRELLSPAVEPDEDESLVDKGSALLDKARSIRSITRLR